MTLIDSTQPTSGNSTSLLRRGLNFLVRPFVVDDYLDYVAPLQNSTYLRAKVASVRPETTDSVAIDLRVGRGWQPHEPGQYLRIGVDIDGVRQWRCYSITTPALSPAGVVSITVKAIPDGLVSNYLVRQLRAGDLVHLEPAAGEFLLPAPVPEKLLFVTAGSGITPVMAMLRSTLTNHSSVTVVHSAKTAQDVIFGAELRGLAAAGEITLIERHTSTSGRLSPTEFADLVPDWRERHTLACGPNELLDSCESHWAEAGLADSLTVERFSLGPVVTGAGGTVHFTQSAKTADAPGDRPLLDVGESAGVQMPSGCRMGVCFGCVGTLKSGAVRDLRTGDITTATIDDHVTIQTCITAAAGPCDIEL